MSLLNLSQVLSANYRVTFPGLGITDGIDISRVAFRLGSIEVYWYGLLIAAAVLLAMFLSVRHAKQFDLKSDDILDFYLFTIPIGIIGARIYYVIFAWDEFSHNILSVFDTRNGGLAFYGGIITGILTVFLIAKYKKIPFQKAAHFLIPYVPLGQAIGRWGNFFNQEAFGINTTLPWGMYSNGTRNYLSSLNDASVDPNLPVHPTFLYEFVGNLIIYFILIAVRKRTKAGYQPLAWYLILYGTLRFFVERIRTDSLYIGATDIRVSALLSALMVIVGVAYLLSLRFGKSRTSRRSEMAAMLNAEPSDSSDTGVSADVTDEESPTTAANAGEEAKDPSSADAEPIGETDDIAEASEETFDMDRLIQDARVAAARALENEQINDDGNAEDPDLDSDLDSENRS